MLDVVILPFNRHGQQRSISSSRRARLDFSRGSGTNWSIGPTSTRGPKTRYACGSRCTSFRERDPRPLLTSTTRHCTTPPKLPSPSSRDTSTFRWESPTSPSRSATIQSPGGIPWALLSTIRFSTRVATLLGGSALATLRTASVRCWARVAVPTVWSVAEMDTEVEQDPDSPAAIVRHMFEQSSSECSSDIHVTSCLKST